MMFWVFFGKYNVKKYKIYIKSYWHIETRFGYLKNAELQWQENISNLDFTKKWIPAIKSEVSIIYWFCKKKFQPILFPGKLLKVSFLLASFRYVKTNFEFDY